MDKNIKKTILDGFKNLTDKSINLSEYTKFEKGIAVSQRDMNLEILEQVLDAVSEAKQVSVFEKAKLFIKNLINNAKK